MNSTDLQGVDELVAMFETIKDETMRKTGRAALRKAGNVIRDKARENAERVDDPSTPENIAKNITLRWDGKLYRRTKNMAFQIGVRGGARAYRSSGGVLHKSGGKNPGGDTRHWRFIEFGTQNSPAQPFLRPALPAVAAKASQTFIDEYKKGIERAIKRASKKGTTA